MSHLNGFSVYAVGDRVGVAHRDAGHLERAAIDGQRLLDDSFALLEKGLSKQGERGRHTWDRQRVHG